MPAQIVSGTVSRILAWGGNGIGTRGMTEIALLRDGTGVTIGDFIIAWPGRTWPVSANSHGEVLVESPAAPACMAPLASPLPGRLQNK
jgi:hypothetical protein